MVRTTRLNRDHLFLSVDGGASAAPSRRRAGAAASTLGAAPPLVPHVRWGGASAGRGTSGPIVLPFARRADQERWVEIRLDERSQTMTPPGKGPIHGWARPRLVQARRARTSSHIPGRPPRRVGRSSALPNGWPGEAVRSDQRSAPSLITSRRTSRRCAVVEPSGRYSPLRPRN